MICSDSMPSRPVRALLKTAGLHGAIARSRPVPGCDVGPITAMTSDERESPCVLVVDDEAPIVEFLCILLEDEGFDVVPAYDGVQAWDLARRVHPDLVISDVMMPRMSGVELLHRLRRSGELGQTPVILMSAVTRPQVSDQAAFLPKPFDVDRMLGLVNANLAAD